MVKYIYNLFFLFIFLNPCLAQENQDNIFPTSYETNKNTSSQTGRNEQAELIKKEPSPINLDLYTRLDLSDINTTFPDYWTELANQPNITYVYDYNGLHGIIHKQIMRGLNRLFDRAVKNFWEENYLHPMDRDQLMRQFNLEANDAGSRWWEQRQHFYDHYPIEQGGHRVEKITIGRNSDILSIGPVTLSNQGKLSWDGWRFSVSPEQEIPTRRVRGELDPPLRTDPQADPRNYSLGIQPPRGNLFTGENISVSGAIRLGLRANELSNNKSSITGKLEILCYGTRQRPWLGIEIEGRARPFVNDYGVEVVIALLNF